MKLRCDVCNDSDAAVFCSAKESALCGHCDHRANKLASRHQRSSLVLGTAEDAPPCDICRFFVRRGDLSCFVSGTERSSARSVICRYTQANEHAKKHDGFILTRLKLLNCSRTTHSKLADESLKAIPKGVVDLSNAGCGSLFEYLMETQPGWRVDEFLESCCSSSGISKVPF